MTRYQKRTRARNLAAAALKAGKIERRPCEICGAEPAEMHHDDYDRPLDVRFLCRPHHREADKWRGANRKPGQPAIVFRPAIPRGLEQAARIAGAPMGLGPRDYIVLVLRDALYRAGALPSGWSLSSEEIEALEAGARP